MASLQPLKNLSVKVDGSAITSGKTYSSDKTVNISASANTGRYKRQSVITLELTASSTKKTVTITQSGTAVHTSSDSSISATQTSRIVNITGTSNATKILIKPQTFYNGSWADYSPADGTIPGYYQNSSTYAVAADAYKGTYYGSALGSNTPTANGATCTLAKASGDTYYSLTPANDPGKDNQYSFSIPVTIPVNGTETAGSSKDYVYKFKLVASGTDDAGNSVSYTTATVTITSTKYGLKMNIYTSSSSTTSEISTKSMAASDTSTSFFVDANTEWKITF